MTNPDFESFRQISVEPIIVQAATEMAEDFCQTECPVKETLGEQGMVCSFMVRQAFKDEIVIPLAGAVLSDVASNSWFHCVDGMRKEEKPIVLVDKDQRSYADIVEYLS